MAAYTMPSKVQATLAAGRALFVAAHGDSASVAQESGAGIAVRPGDSAAIAEGIQDLVRMGRAKLRALGQQGRLYYERMFSAESGVERVETALRHAMKVG
jgi:glycosyltransferase involved in cell wall biosynthesis